MNNEQKMREALEIGQWVPCVKKPIVVHVRMRSDDGTDVITREGITPVLSDDLIMRGVSGEQYPIGREIFEQTYVLGEALATHAGEQVGLTDAVSALKAIVEMQDEPCRYDHDGYCQAHNLDHVLDGCRVEKARRVIAAHEAKKGGA